MHLDPPTLLIVQAFGALLSVVVLAALLRTRRESGTLAALVGCALMSGFCVLLLGRNALPVVISILVANTMVIGSTLAFVVACRQISLRPGLPKTAIAVAVFAILAFAVVFVSGAGYRPRALLISGALLPLFILAARELARDNGLQREPTRRFLFFLMGVGVFGMSARLIALVAIPLQSDNILLPELERTFAFLPGLLIGLGTGVGFALVHLERSEIAARALALHDPLTGLYNRRAFVELVNKELVRHVRSFRPTSLLVLDIDHFKTINDTRGHLEGDRALVHLADILRSALRPGDTVARIGGEEFCILLPETDHVAALTAAKRICSTVEESPVCSIQAAPLHITASLGVTTTSEGQTSWDALFREADEALYRAKDRGRNQVVSAAHPISEVPTESAS